MAKSLGKQIDAIYAQDRKIKAVEADLKELKRTRAKMESKLLKGFDKEDIDGCKGTRGVGHIRRAKFPSIKDRRKFNKYVLKHKALDLFQSRVSAQAYNDRLEEGEQVPGVEVFERISVSVTKRGNR